MSRIVDVSVEPLDLALAEPFEIALGTQYEAPNVLVTVETDGGVVGFGEGSPDHHVTGETQASTLEIASTAADILTGRHVTEYRPLITDLHAAFPGAVSALFSLETAIIDAYCRCRGIPMAELFGGPPETIRTDLTIPITPPETAAERASAAVEMGFETLKVKVGPTSPPIWSASERSTMRHLTRRSRWTRTRPGRSRRRCSSTATSPTRESSSRSSNSRCRRPT